MSRYVVALDLSLTSTGMVAIPRSWGGDFRRIAHQTIKPKIPPKATESERIDRLLEIERGVVDFLANADVAVVGIEQYAFTSVHGHAHALGELGGIIKRRLRVRGTSIEVVPPHSARKLILGKLPRRDHKAVTRGALTKMGAPVEWDDDTADAFVIANYVLAEYGEALVVPQEGRAA